MRPATNLPPDVSADIDRCPEGAGLKAMAEGFALLHGKADQRKLELESPVYDALYEWCKEQVALRSEA